MSLLDEVMNWTPNHLTNLSQYANTQGEMWFGHYNTLLAHVTGLNSLGQAHDALLERHLHDTGVASTAAETAMAAGEFAFMATGNLDALHSPAVFAINAAKSAGFTIDPNELTLTPVSSDKTREMQRQTLQNSVQSTVQAFQTHRETVAGVLQGHQDDLQMMDNKFGTAGATDDSNDNGWDNPPMRPIGGAPVTGNAGAQTPMEKGTGGPPMPADWPKQAPPPAMCPPEEKEKKLESLAQASAGFGAAIGTIEVAGPLSLITVPAAAIGLDHAADDFDECLERGH